MREHGVDKVLQGLPLQCVEVNIPLQIVRCVHRRLRPSLSVGIEMRRTRKPASLLRIPTLYPSLAGRSRHIVWCCLISHNHFRKWLRIEVYRLSSAEYSSELSSLGPYNNGFNDFSGQDSFIGSSFVCLLLFVRCHDDGICTST